MRNLIALVLVALFISCTTNTSTGTSQAEYTVHVWGNCEKCQATIEKACKITGVSSANWGIDSKLLTVKIDTAIVSLNTVLEEIAKAGYDNEVYYGDDYAYGSLPQCCQYDRRPTEVK